LSVPDAVGRVPLDERHDAANIAVRRAQQLLVRVLQSVHDGSPRAGHPRMSGCRANRARRVRRPGVGRFAA